MQTLRSAALAMTVSLMLVLLPVPAVAEPTECSDLGVAVATLTDPTSGATLLTQFGREMAGAVEEGFHLVDATAMTVSSHPGADRVGVWRLYHPGTRDFTWAAEGADLVAAEASGYRPQFLQFYASSVPSRCTEPAYRMGIGTGTRVAVGDAERDELLEGGWSLLSAQPFYVGPGDHGGRPTRQATAPTEPHPPVPPAGASESFTIAVIPDTQQETWSDTDTRLADRSTWLVNNATKLNLKYVTHIGDVVDWGNAAPEQYTRAQKGLAPLKGKIPYSLTIGNHDTAAVCQGGSACPGVNTNLAVRDTKAFNTAFPLNTFPTIKGAYEPGKVDNTYSTFTAAGQKWMVLNLELWPRQGAIDWAKKIVAANPDHNIIISTHAYLNGDATISTSNGGYGATSPKHLYDTLIKVYPNIKIVVSGHTGTAATRTDTGTNGNKIISLMQTYHSRTTNPVRLITINVANGTLKNWVYAPKTNETLAPETTTTGLNFTR
ncbi:metallophosphoesterase [Tessaracoccus aquimaris]|uniref:metallophosphoesterase n=1 Tax=Tessaracoccus aquimaris TaxID=1332264 RepID=UPI001314E400|nr:metallophosphoesterase [Tessaracoccus aquimaris]